MANFRECIRLSVADDQRGFVAYNMYSLAEAKADGVSNPLAIYTGETMVGFIMYCFEADSGTGCIGRLMVAADHQRRGYGRSAMSRRQPAVFEARPVAAGYGPPSSRPTRSPMRCTTVSASVRPAKSMRARLSLCWIWLPLADISDRLPDNQVCIDSDRFSFLLLTAYQPCQDGEGYPSHSL